MRDDLFFFNFLFVCVCFFIDLFIYLFIYWHENAIYIFYLRQKNIEQ